MHSTILKKSRKVNRSTFSMSMGTLLSRLSGFVRDMLIGFLFTRTETDAFFVAFRFPNFFRRFFGEGALTVSFVPVFIECLYQEGSKEENMIKARNLMNSIYTLLLICISVLTAIGVIFMDELVHFMFDQHAFSFVQGKIDMTIFLSRLLFLYLFLVVTYAYYSAIANALRRFFIPALAPAGFNLSIILSMFLMPVDQFQYSATVLAIGVLIGGFVQSGMVAIILIQMRFLPLLKFSILSQPLKMVVQRFLPAIIGVGGFALIGVLNVYFAGWLEEGAHTYIYYADRLLEFPKSLVSVSMGTALLPTLSKYFTKKQLSSLFELAAHQRDLLLYIIVPCAIGLFFLGSVCIEVLFEHGQFDTIATQQTTKVLKIYSVLLIFVSLVQVLSSCFFAIKNTWYPAITTLIGLLVHISITPFLIQIFALEGLVWATTLSSGVQLIALLVAYPKLIGHLHLKRTGVRFLKTIPVLIVVGAYIYYGFQMNLWLWDHLLSDSFAKGFALLTTILSSIVIYGYLGLKLQLIQAVECFYLLQLKWRGSNHSTRSSTGSTV